MKKIALIVALMGLLAMGSKASAQMSFSLKAGLNVANTITESGDIKIRHDYRLGFNAGVGLEFGINELFAIEADALFSLRGFSSNVDLGGGTKYKSTYSFFYVDIPINWKAYIFRLDNGLKFFAQVGPYVGVGLFGNYKNEYGGSKEKQSFGFGGNQGYKRLDWGLDGGLGMEYDNLSIAFIWWQGLANIAQNDPLTSKVNHSCMSIELGWKF